MDALTKALARLQSLAATNAPLGARRSAEKQYCVAYQKLVRAGSMPQVRGKYRRIP